MKISNSCARIASALLTVAALLAPSVSSAFDTGVSDDRVSLPEGPGSLEGLGDNVSVDSNMGLMRYSVPVLVPSGFAGLTPQLSLRYSSGGGASIVGMGWSMPVPSIERMTMRGVPRYVEEDRFVANGGEELVRVTQGEDATQPAIYRKRFESDFARHLWHDRDGGQSGYWEVQYADGRVGFFGADASGRIEPSAIEASGGRTFKYHLVEMLDVYDHRVRYGYVKDGTISLLSAVEYVFTDGQPVYQVQLSYEGRSDATSDAKAGFDRILTQRLDGIRVLTRGQQLRRYALTYDRDDESGRRTRLARVETFGRADERYPLVHSFGYSRGLGAQCNDVDCGEPFLVDMTGSDGLGVAFGSGTANLVDINGDALPDLIDASTTQASHRFFVNQLASDGTHRFASATTSANGEVSAFPIASPRVQFIDVNGDGFADLLNGGVTQQRVLLNRGDGDWAPVQELAGSPVWNGTDAELRFMDYDNDMDVDLIRSTPTQTFVFENDGDFDFTRRDLAPLGVAFSENIQFTDINGDGLLDVVQMQTGLLRYKTNFGRGRFADQFVTLNHPFDANETPLALVEDLDNDGYADLVVATGNTVKYVLNRNGEAFEAPVELSAAGGQGLPNREATTTVLAADMNGNGSVDVVWVSATGQVQYLDLFPVRSHLLTRIENGLGRVTEISYEPSVQQRARSAEAGEPWANPLPYAMVVVSQTVELDLLTEVRDVTDFAYRDGFYDGIERQFRGYAEVVMDLPGDASQLDGRQITRYDVGRVQPHLNGKLLFEESQSDGAVLKQTTHTFGDPAQCPVAEVPDNATLVSLGRRPIGFACEIATETSIQEGVSAEQHILTRTSMEYGDGYGNVTRTANEGVVSVGGRACGACTRSADAFGAPCGNQCLGDEQYVERTFVPNTETGGRWLLDKVAREIRFGVEDGSGLFAEDVYFYDGEDFVGLANGRLTQGKLTRTESRVDDGQTIQAQRSAFDRHGNVVGTLDPLGEVGGTTHRREMTYDADGLRVVQTDVFNEADGTPYRLRRSYQYDELFDKVLLSSSWVRIEGGQAVTSADPTAYTYDAFGRPASILLPGGDSGASPTMELTYDLGNPTTRMITRRRSQVGGALDLETIRCVDGRGRTFQTRRRLASGRYLVDGFTVYNARSQRLQVFQSYESDLETCESSIPSGVRSTTYRYDGLGRLVETTLPDASASGGATVQRMVYAPLSTLMFDGEDNDPSSPHFDTPEVRVADGLERLVSLQRRLTDGTATTVLEYDALGRSAGYVDAEGNRKAQTHDALGRLVRIDDPNAGAMTLRYDDAGNIVERTDARGVTTAYRYDGLNRQIEKFDAADREGTLIQSEYDGSSRCEASRCPNTAGQIAVRSYPGGVDFMGYDVRRRPFSMVRVIEGKTYSLETRFDNADRAVERTFPDGRSLTYRFDGASRVVGIDGVLDQVGYTPQNQLAALERSNGLVDAYAYDERLRVVNLTVSGLQDITVDYDRANNVRGFADLAGGALMPATDYTYDAWYRSVSVDRDGEVTEMGFDLLDNLLRKNDASYTYGGRPGAPTAIDGQAIAYDEAGCVLRGQGFENTWDFDGRLVSSAGAQTVRSVYGADHLRVARHDDGLLTHYVSPDFEVRDGAAVIYARLGRQRVARLESAAFAAEWLGNAGAEVNAGAAYLEAQAGAANAEQWLAAAARKMLLEDRPAVVALHRDHIDSLTLATGDGGEVLGQRAYDVFGGISSSSGFVDRYGFTGQEHEPHTGLIRFAHRFLSTETGQWLSPDPAFRAVTPTTQARLPEAVARYSYVLNNPGTLVDPDGLSGRGPSLSGVKRRLGKIKRGIGRMFRRGRRGGRGARWTTADVDNLQVTSFVHRGQDASIAAALRQLGGNPTQNAGTQPQPRAVNATDRRGRPVELTQRGPVRLDQTPVPTTLTRRDSNASLASVSTTGSGSTVASRNTELMPAALPVVPSGMAPSQVMRPPANMTLDFFYIQ